MYGFVFVVSLFWLCFLEYGYGWLVNVGKVWVLLKNEREWSIKTKMPFICRLCYWVMSCAMFEFIGEKTEISFYCRKVLVLLVLQNCIHKWEWGMAMERFE